MIYDLAELCGLPRSEVSAVGETSVAEYQTRPDFAVTARKSLVGYIEVKAPGKGADPRKFRDKHDKEQWKKLQSLPNLLYTDGNEFCLCRSGEIVGTVVTLDGDVKTSGAALDAPSHLQLLFENFFRWEPIAPRNAHQLAELTAQLCRLLREEVVEKMAGGSRALTSLASDWRKVLFPDATDAQFADGYAQAVTFGLLMARAHDIRLRDGLDQVAIHLRHTDSLIGSALRLLTDNVESQKTLEISLGTIIRVLDAVHWPTISKGDPEAWLYFYENFLEIYDNELRKQTGSYYTPPEVVSAMVRLVDDVLRLRFNLVEGLASPTVTVADPAVGTGTFILGVLARSPRKVEADHWTGGGSRGDSWRDETDSRFRTSTRPVRRRSTAHDCRSWPHSRGRLPQGPYGCSSRTLEQSLMSRRSGFPPSSDHLPNRVVKRIRSRETSLLPSLSVIRRIRRKPRAAAAGSNRAAPTLPNHLRSCLATTGGMGRRRPCQTSS